MKVDAWLNDLGLEQFAEAFVENDVDSNTLAKLTAEDLADIGVKSVGHRRKLLDAIGQLNFGGNEPPVDAGSSSEPKAERRQVTVLFADLAGFTKLSHDLGAEETHTLLNRYFEAVDGIVENYGGSIDKHIGDNVMAVFGAPMAHDDDPLRAVRAALDIQQRMIDLSDEVGHAVEAHIGIASGQVVASGTGSDAHREYTVTGDSVNLASRLQERAEPGKTLIAGSVQRAVDSHVECEALGEVMVKGLDESVQAWRAKALRGVAEDESRMAFVGRRTELRQFAAVAEACRETGHGEAIIVRGEAGIGKTRLVEGFTAIAKERGFADFKGLVLDFGVGKGQDAIRTIVRRLLRIPSGSGEELRRKMAYAAIGEGLLASNQRVFLNDLLDLPQPLEDRAMYDAMDNSMRNEGKRGAVAALIRAVSDRGPMLIIVEDVHWADPLMLTYLARMTSTASDCPALLVMTSRIEGDPLDRTWRGTTGGSPLITIDLGPLRKDEAIELARTFIEASNKFAMDCIERAEGNPLFLEQLLRNAEQRGEDEIPASLQSLVLARMDRLSTTDKLALQAASVIGKRFELDALRCVFDDADYDCAELIEQHLVRPEGDGFLFAHALIQEGVYGSLLKATKCELHARAAEWFADQDPVLHAEHLERAEDPAAPGAYLVAGKAYAGLYHFEVALRLVARGLALASEAGDKCALTCLRGELLHDTGEIAASMDAFRDAIELAPGDAERVPAWIGLAAGIRLTDALESAFGLLEQAEAAATSHDLTRDLARIHHLRGNLYFPRGNIEGCRLEHERALAYAEQAGSHELMAHALGGLGDAYYASGQMTTAHGYFDQCVDLSRQHGFGAIEVAYLSMRADTHAYQTELRRALADLERATEIAANVGNRRAEFIAIWGLMNLQLDTGLAPLPKIKEEVDQARKIVEQLGLKRCEPVLDMTLAMIAEREGNHVRADELLGVAYQVCQETGVAFVGPWVLGIRSVTTTDPEVRQWVLAEGERLLAEESCIGHNYYYFYRYAIDACLAASDWAGVERYAAAFENYTRPDPLPWSDFFIARGRALAAFGRGRRDDATMRSLTCLRGDAERVGLKTALPALDMALAAG